MSTPTTFEAHGHTWTAHDPIHSASVPCDSNALVHILRKDQFIPKKPMKAEFWAWGVEPPPNSRIIGWRHATPPQEKDEPPADWRKDSSLETWFPLTAQELNRLREENANMRTAIKEAHEDLRSFVRAGFGHSTDYGVQAAAIRSASNTIKKLSPFTESK